MFKNLTSVNIKLGCR